jgi:ATP-dependent Lon protease
MTGEITLRGTILPVGGIKEKVLAAHRAGVHTVILPRLNRADMREVPVEVRDSLHIHYVDSVEEALAISLQLSPETHFFSTPFADSTPTPRAHL